MTEFLTFPLEKSHGNYANFIVLKESINLPCQPEQKEK